MATTSEATLADVCSLIADCPHNTAPESDAGYAFAVGTKAIANGRIDFTQARAVSVETFATWTMRAVPEPGDLILCREAPVGPVALVPTTPRVCLGQRTVLLRPNRQRVVPEYLLYALLSPRVQASLRDLSEGSTVAHLNVAEIRRFELSLAPLEEQQRIVGVLGALDDKIDSNCQLAGVLEETAAALFRARFVHFVGAEEFEDSELGPIPRGWRTQPIGDVLRVVGGSTPSTKQPAFWNGGHCWITPKDLSGAVSPIVLDTARHVTDEGIAQITSRLLPSRTVLLSSRAPVGYTAVSFVPIAVNQGFIAIPPTNSVPSEFVYFWLRERMDEIKAHAGGTTFAEISKRAFRPLPMIVPPSATLDTFRGVAEPIFDKMAGLEVERRTLTQIRDALLPKLVSGEIRVPDTADPAEVIEPMVA